MNTHALWKSDMENNASTSTQLTTGLVKADVPWKPQTSISNEKERVLKTVRGILNKMNAQTFDTQVDRLLASGIDSADILEGMASIVYYKTISEPKFFPMYAKLCVHLIRVAPQFPSDKPDGKSVSFTGKLFNLCQKEFEGAYKWNGGIEPQTTRQKETDSNANLRSLGNIRLIGELFKQNKDENITPPNKNVEALCVLFKTVGKQLEESTKSGMVIDKYFVRLKELSNSPNSVWRIRFMVRDVLDLRENKWIPRQEEANEIDLKMERSLGLRPSKENIQNGHGATGYRRNIFSTSRGMRSEGRMPSPAGLIQGQERPPMTFPRSQVINPNLLPRGLLSGKTTSPAYYGGSIQPGPAIPAAQEPKRSSDLTLLTDVIQKVKMVEMRTTFEASLKTIESGSKRSSDGVREPYNLKQYNSFQMFITAIYAYFDVPFTPFAKKLYSRLIQGHGHFISYARALWKSDMERNASTSTQPVLELVKVAVPWESHTSLPTEKERVLKTGVATLLYYKTISETQLFPMYAKLCVHLTKVAPQFPSDEPNGKIESFRRILLNLCQMEFEGACELKAETKPLTAPEAVESNSKLRFLANIRLIGEFFKQRVIPEKIVHHCIQELLGSDAQAPLAEENVDALCLLLRTVGKVLKESPKSRMIIDGYFARLREISYNPHLVLRVRLMVRDVLDLRANKWIPRQKEENEIDVEMERRLGLTPPKPNIRNGMPGGIMSAVMPGMPGRRRNLNLVMPRGIMSAGQFGRRTRYGHLVRSDFISGVKSEGCCLLLDGSQFRNVIK
eukprot:Gb_19613 [translate_table: standard]